MLRNTADEHLAALKKVLPKKPLMLVGHSMSSLLGLEPHITKI
jgi:surfactin synthase thioesterase subunit